MTRRKPLNVSFPGWVKLQIREAEAEGAFQNLSGLGKPLPALDRPQHELEWVAGLLRREGVDAASVLPPALALAKEAELLPERIEAARSSTAVRELVEDLNARIRYAWRQPQEGPPMRVRTIDVESAVAEWHAAHPLPAPTATSPAAPRARWWRR